MQSVQEKETTLTFRGSDILVPFRTQDLKEAGADKALKRQIVAISEGTHNGDYFSPEEIQKMVTDALSLRDAENRTNLAAPLVLDHSYKFLDKVGATFDLTFQEKILIRNIEVKNAAVASVEFWTGTPMLDEVAARVQKDPENTFFSVRVRGLLHYDQERDQTYWTDLRLLHIAVVDEPADGNARLIGELSRKGTPDFSLSANSQNQETMPKEEEFTALAGVVKELAAKVDGILQQSEAANSQKAEQAAAADLADKASVMAEIFALDKDVNRDFVKTLTIEQLSAYKADLERRVDTGTSEKGKASGAGGAPTTEDLAKKLIEG